MPFKEINTPIAIHPPVGGLVHAVIEQEGALLEIDEVLESGWLRVRVYKDLIGVMVSDVGGSLNVQFSTKGTAATLCGDEDIPLTGGTPTADSSIGLCVIADYVKFKFTNGGVIQASFVFSFKGRQLS